MAGQDDRRMAWRLVESGLGGVKRKTSRAVMPSRPGDLVLFLFRAQNFGLDPFRKI